nr:TIGR02186 family protein [Gemmobacter serpentinus]
MRLFALRAALLATLAVTALPVMPLPLAAETIVAGLSQSSVSITADYAGSEILIYGAVKREEPILPGRSLRVIITVSGPDLPVVVRRKDRVGGIWINTDRIRPGAVPSFYAVATSAPLEDAISPEEDLMQGITLPRILRDGDARSQPFLDAIRRIRTAEGFYSVKENTIALTEETLFRTDVLLPTALVEGNYTVRVFLTRDGKVVDSVKRTIWVRKAGLERFIYNAAHDQPLLYGLASLLMAALAGWGASALFSRLRW